MPGPLHRTATVRERVTEAPLADARGSVLPNQCVTVERTFSRQPPLPLVAARQLLGASRNFHTSVHALQRSSIGS